MKLSSSHPWGGLSMSCFNGGDQKKLVMCILLIVPRCRIVQQKTAQLLKPALHLYIADHS